MEKDSNKDYFLWQRFKGGDENAFYLLYDHYVDELFLFGGSFTKDLELVKDCIHDLFLDLYKYRKQLSDTNNIRFYLFRSLRRKIYKEQRKVSFLVSDNRVSSGQTDGVPAFENTIIEEEITSENHRLLLQATKSLTVRQQKALSLRFGQDLSYREIAELLDISVESTRTIIYRALKILRNILKKGNHPTIQFLVLFLRYY